MSSKLFISTGRNHEGNMQKSRRNGIYVAIKLSRVGPVNAIRRRFSAISRQIYVNFPSLSVSFYSQVQPRRWHRRAATVSTHIYGDQASWWSRPRGSNFRIRAEPGWTAPRQEAPRSTSIGRPRTDIRSMTYREWGGCSGTARWSFCRFRPLHSARMCTARLIDAWRAILSAEC